MKKKWFSDSSCPSNRCSSGAICSIKWSGGYGCCLSGDSCEIGYLPFFFFPWRIESIKTWKKINN